MAAKQSKRGRTRSPATSSRSSPRVSRPQGQADVASPAAPAPAVPLPPGTPRIPGLIEFPTMYNETYLRALPRDPGTIFAFWEIAPDKFTKIQKTKPRYAAQSSTHLLRLYAVGGGRDGDHKPRERAVGDTIVEESTGSRYIPVPEPGCRYRVEYGIMSPRGNYLPLCRSNEVDVPAGRVREAARNAAPDDPAQLLFDISARSSIAATAAPSERAREWDGTVSDALQGETGAGGQGATYSSRFISY